MNFGIKTIIFPVRDIAKAKSLYTSLLGVPPYTDQSYYVGFRDGDQEIGLDPAGHAKGMTGATIYWQVSDIKKSLKSLVASGARIEQEVIDVGRGKLVARVRDADNNVIGLIQDVVV
ncbi:VOC family protein [Dehalogenimonas etheniformans]|uniref:Glyoxalase n=1 Tax=Dehalogenimonas etheniformans TaxID=1536648 RepID=A0A2P5P6J3_9CHLR|nr:VOC family protein [Dehalogenimonas etheniformans]PPD57900.1 glyoxalase [Dehalogenimonas etheniformans]QNT75449.1 glyoxalase [Dehalogenimonas etheniformans]